MGYVARACRADGEIQRTEGGVDYDRDEGSFVALLAGLGGKSIDRLVD